MSALECLGSLATDKLRATLPTIDETGNNVQHRTRTSSECSGASFDSLSLSSEEGYDNDGEVCMEQVQQNGNNHDGDASDVCEEEIIESERADEGVMEVEYM
jgi:hypothetical protein